MTKEEKRQFMLQIAEETEVTANKSGLYYIICFWMSPITDKIDYRRAYFDDVSEGICYRGILIERYQKKFNYYIASNMLAGDTDGGLLDD